MAEYLADHQIRASLNAQKRLRIYNPSLDDVDFFFEDQLLVIPAQEITEFSSAEGRIAVEALLDHLMNKNTDHNKAPRAIREKFRSEILTQ